MNQGRYLWCRPPERQPRSDSFPESHRAGHRVIGVDVNAEVVSIVNQGRIHVVEPDLDKIVAYAVSSSALSAELIPSPADVFLIAVPTPFRSGTDGIPQPNID